MIPKNNLTQFINHNKEYEELINRVDDAIQYVLRTHSFKVLFFVKDTTKTMLDNLFKSNRNITYSLLSYIDNSENLLLVVHLDNELIDLDDVLTLYKLEYNTKFNSLNHRDILGTLMSLKLNRDMIGDIFFNNEVGYFEVANSISQYIDLNIDKISNARIKLTKINYPIKKIQEYQSSTKTVKSFRLDLIISSITNLSREKVKNLIIENNVKVNHLVCTNYSYSVNNNDIISIKQYGRYHIEFDLRQTKKQNYVITYNKYV